MPTLQYGLNIPKKLSKEAKQVGAKKRKTIFDEDSDDADAQGPDGPESIENFGEYSTAPKSHSETRDGRSLEHPHERKNPLISQYGDLSSKRTATKHASAAQELDSSVYDYDAVYDSLHAKPEKSKASEGPKYMQNLLKAAEVRKRDQLRAKEKMLAKEREAEGEEYADKEKFVTGAYKAQQEELLRLEQEEKKREEEAAGKKNLGSTGMTNLYKGLLAREEARHEAIANNLEEEKEKVRGDIEKQTKDDAVTNTPMVGVEVNDDGEIVDKRQLLKAGLNIAKKTKETDSKADHRLGTGDGSRVAVARGLRGTHNDVRERQTRMLEAQLEAGAKRAADQEQLEQESLLHAAKSRRTETEVQSARERYLQRKREAEEAKAANAATNGV